MSILDTMLSVLLGLKPRSELRTEARDTLETHRINYADPGIQPPTVKQSDQ